MVSNNYHSASLSFSLPERRGKRERDKEPLSTNKSIKVEQEALILKLPIDTLNKIMRFTDWLTDTRSIALSCRRFRTVVERRPQVVLAKAFFFLRHHPFSYLGEASGKRPIVQDQKMPSISYEVYADLAFCERHTVEEQQMPFQPDSPMTRGLMVKSLTPMLSRACITSEQCSVVDAQRLRDCLGNVLKGHESYFDALFHYLLDSNPSDLLISSFLIPLMSYQVFGISNVAAKLAKEGKHPTLQERAIFILNNEKAFSDLLKDPDWTEEKIETVDWSLLYFRRKYLHDLFPQETFTKLFESDNWLTSLSNIDFPETCLLVLLISLCQNFQPSALIFKPILKKFERACDDLAFMKKVLEAADLHFRIGIYSCCSERLKLNRELALCALENGLPWSFLPPNFLEDKEMVLAAAKRTPYSDMPADHNLIQKASQNIKKALGEDKEFLLEFLKNRIQRENFSGRNGFESSFFIQFDDLSPTLVADEQFMREAAQYHPPIFKHVIQNFDNVQDVVALIQQVSTRLWRYFELPEKWKRNEEVAKVLIEKTGNLRDISAHFHSNREIALKAIAKHPFNLQRTPLSKNKEFVLEAFEINPRILALISFKDQKGPLKWLAQARFRVLKVVQICGELLKLAPLRFRNDPEIALAATFQDASAIICIDNELLKKEEFLLALHQQAMKRLQPLVEIEMSEEALEKSEATIEPSDPRLAR
jgi:hypothetical protein